MKPDVLIYNTIGPPFTGESVRSAGIGGSELEMTQIAEELALRGHSVTIANGVSDPSTHYGVRYIPSRLAPEHLPKKALLIQRRSEWKWPAPKIHTAVRVTDVTYVQPPFHLWFNAGATAVLTSQWQAERFTQARKKVVINPILDPTPPTDRVPGRFVFASAPGKGMAATIGAWMALQRHHPSEMSGTELVISPPGFHYEKLPPEAYPSIRVVGPLAPPEYRAMIASAEGLFMVSTAKETFCCAAALAEREGARTHILAREGLCGIPEACVMISENDQAFVHTFLRGRMGALDMATRELARSAPDRSRAALIPQWEKVLGL